MMIMIIMIVITMASSLVRGTVEFARVLFFFFFFFFSLGRGSNIIYNPVAQLPDVTRREIERRNEKLHPVEHILSSGRFYIQCDN